jgi:hypothetical protein
MDFLVVGEVVVGVGADVDIDEAIEVLEHVSHHAELATIVTSELLHHL